MNAERIRAALIRFFWTWLFAFVAQPPVAALATGEWTITWQMAASAAIAAFVYAIKKFAAPDTVL